MLCGNFEPSFSAMRASRCVFCKKALCLRTSPLVGRGGEEKNEDKSWVARSGGKSECSRWWRASQSVRLRPRMGSSVHRWTSSVADSSESTEITESHGAAQGETWDGYNLLFPRDTHLAPYGANDWPETASIPKSRPKRSWLVNAASAGLGQRSSLL
ncbi:hypothetical protein VHEMI05335 [[Torrubiella] hemipterigena]|uniref:Uncharacterized protein n=1 Tax=[Torrubiella] hemipterigena TaxID=1531966 RepID=A0A0A1T3T6_9HYPO|nr:hypothetical protein VHEMI05335 [[Torrubiella] hemipterigena]